MNPLSRSIDIAARVRDRIQRFRVKRRWAKLCENGMHIGSDVWLPDSTWIDPNYCFLISIGDHCGFGEECMILAHDAQMDEFIDAARIGRVTIHPSCHIGSRTVILPGTEIGPRTIVGANSVVSKSLPPDTVCSGSPARVICTLEDYLAKHRARLAIHPTFPYTNNALTAAERAHITEAVRLKDGYIVGGRSAELRGEGGTPRTPLGPRPKMPTSSTGSQA
jgi:maltose O-acetyltransferase